MTAIVSILDKIAYDITALSYIDVLVMLQLMASGDARSQGISSQDFHDDVMTSNFLHNY